MISDQELVDQYGKFCTYMAWQVVGKRSELGEDKSGLRPQDAEDFSQLALIKLISLPQTYRDQPYYVRQVIILAVCNAKRDRLRWKRTRDWQPPHVRGERWHGNGIAEHGEDYFDTLPGRDGLAEYTQVNHDCARMLEILPKLHAAERLVLELHFGVNGCQASTIRTIAKKLGHRDSWVEVRLKRGLAQLKSLLVTNPSQASV